MSEVQRVRHGGSVPESLLEVFEASVGYATLVQVHDLEVVAEGILCLDQMRYGLSTSVTDVGVALEGEADQTLFLFLRLLVVASTSRVVAGGCSIALSLICQYRRVFGCSSWAVACSDGLASSSDIV